MQSAHFDTLQPRRGPVNELGEHRASHTRTLAVPLDAPPDWQAVVRSMRHLVTSFAE
ncbi:hypothetical protein GCM10025762_43040 [Haloechinothrix salitolerans]